MSSGFLKKGIVWKLNKNFFILIINNKQRIIFNNLIFQTCKKYGGKQIKQTKEMQ